MIARWAKGAPSIFAHVKRAIVGVALLLSVGCGAAVSMPRVASSLGATKQLWLTACKPTPVDARVCDASFDAINELIDVYIELNDELPAGAK